MTASMQVVAIFMATRKRARVGCGWEPNVKNLAMASAWDRRVRLGAD